MIVIPAKVASKPSGPSPKAGRNTIATNSSALVMKL